MSDRWAEWLLLRRFAGSEDVRREFMEHLTRVREKVLDNAELASGDVLLDVGCGDGLIAFAGLERGLRTVIGCDISEELLNECHTIAADLGVLDRCRFVQAGAEDLAPIDSASVDVVTTRSVLIYVQDKQRAFEEFFRVLRPGGRISLFEPINHLSNFFTTYDVTQGSGAG
jgi:arsenite methyltransferase